MRDLMEWRFSFAEEAMGQVYENSVEHLRAFPSKILGFQPYKGK